MNETSPLHLADGQDAVHLPSSPADAPAIIAVRAFGHNYDGYVEKYCTPADVGRLVSFATSHESWRVWETHPGGDELVIVTRGQAEFVQRLGDREVAVMVGVGQAIVNPAGVPHTANVVEPFDAVYITAAPGTYHEPRA